MKKSSQKQDKTNWNTDEIHIFVFILIKISELNKTGLNELEEKDFEVVYQIFC